MTLHDYHDSLNWRRNNVGVRMQIVRDCMLISVELHVIMIENMKFPITMRTRVFERKTGHQSSVERLYSHAPAWKGLPWWKIQSQFEPKGTYNICSITTVWDIKKTIFIPWIVIEKNPQDFCSGRRPWQLYYPFRSINQFLTLRKEQYLDLHKQKGIKHASMCIWNLQLPWLFQWGDRPWLYEVCTNGCARLHYWLFRYLLVKRIPTLESRNSEYGSLKFDSEQWI